MPFFVAFRHLKCLGGVKVFTAVLPGLGNSFLGTQGLSEATLAHP